MVGLNIEKTPCEMCGLEPNWEAGVYVRHDDESNKEQFVKNAFVECSNSQNTRYINVFEKD
jgi:hypothetical protein